MKEIVFVGTGGFNTFSAFGLESFELLKSGQFIMTLIYTMGSLVLGLCGIGLGILITR